MLPPNSIILYDGTHASIPTSQFSRYTDMDGVFPIGADAGVGIGDTGGDATHAHTTAHTHTVASHTHTGYLAGAGSADNSKSPDTGGALLENHDHTHAFTSGNPSGGTTASGSINSTVSLYPAYYKFIFIKATSYCLIPVSGCVFSRHATRTGLEFHTASADKFPIGADAGGDAGATGGSHTHTHDLAHTHTTSTHTHTATTGGALTSLYGSSSGKNHPTGSAGDYVSSYHTHSVTLSSATQAINAYSGTSSTTNHEPIHKAVSIYKNTGTGAVMPREGDIVMTDQQTLPTGWVECDGTNSSPDLEGYFIKNPSSASTPTSGGATNHSHTTVSHSHTGNGTHSHTQSVSNHVRFAPNAGGGASAAHYLDQHGQSSPSQVNQAVTANTTSNDLTFSTVNNLPPYSKIHFIMATTNAVNISGGGILGLL